MPKTEEKPESFKIHFKINKKEVSVFYLVGKLAERPDGDILLLPKTLNTCPNGESTFPRNYVQL